MVVGTCLPTAIAPWSGRHAGLVPSTTGRSALPAGSPGSPSPMRTPTDDDVGRDHPNVAAGPASIDRPPATGRRRADRTHGQAAPVPGAVAGTGPEGRADGRRGSDRVGWRAVSARYTMAARACRPWWWPFRAYSSRRRSSRPRTRGWPDVAQQA